MEPPRRPQNNDFLIPSFIGWNSTIRKSFPPIYEFNLVMSTETHRFPFHATAYHLFLSLLTLFRCLTLPRGSPQTHFCVFSTYTCC